MYILCEQSDAQNLHLVLYRYKSVGNLLSTKDQCQVAFSDMDELHDSLIDPMWGDNKFVAGNVLNGTYKRLAIFKDWEEVLRIKETHPELFI